MIAMIEEEKQKQRLLQACGKTAFGCKIAAIALAYGLDKSFACFWMDTETDVVYCMVDGLMILSGTVLKEKESREFLRAVGAQAVMCAVRNAEALSLSVGNSGDVLKKVISSEGKAAVLSTEVNIRDIYGLLEETGMADEFEPFYLDLSHKLRHEAALAATEYRNGELCGCALVSSIDGHAAILSSVAVKEAYRRQGIGSELVKRVESYFPGKVIYALREKDKNREFYRSLDYAKTDTCVYAKLH